MSVMGAVSPLATIPRRALFVSVNGAEALVSADVGFAGIPGLRWIDPATPEIESIFR